MYSHLFIFSFIILPVRSHLYHIIYIFAYKCSKHNTSFLSGVVSYQHHPLHYVSVSSRWVHTEWRDIFHISLHLSITCSFFFMSFLPLNGMPHHIMYGLFFLFSISLCMISIAVPLRGFISQYSVSIAIDIYYRQAYSITINWILVCYLPWLDRVSVIYIIILFLFYSSVMYIYIYICSYSFSFSFYIYIRVFLFYGLYADILNAANAICYVFLFVHVYSLASHFCPGFHIS